MKTIAYEVVEDVLLLVHGRCPPSDEEWTPYIRALEEQFRTRQVRGVLVVTDGAGPDSVQRNKLNELVAKYGGLATAVVSHSAMVRGIVTALGWFHTEIRAFPPQKFIAALTFLGVPSAQHEHLIRRVVTLRFKLAAQRPTGGDARPPRVLEGTIATLDDVMLRRLPALQATLAERRSS